MAAADDSQTLYIDEPASVQPAAQAAAMTWGSLPSQAIAMPAAIPAGTTFGRYRVEALLGEGGMGAVYRAFDTELERTVALKLVRPELAVNEQTMKRFKQELLLASRISHKNILRIHDLGDAGGIKFITMAFVEGTDLARLIDGNGPLPIDRALRFARQLCAALEAAHDEGVVHRDLKPQNVLIDAADNLYVSDFGLAKSLEAEISMGTRTGQILGTPRYMSPEQVEARDVDHRSDLYSAGLIIYEMFTAELPFRGESAMQLMYQRVSELPRDPRRARAGLPDYIARIILKCLEKDPARRYQSAREILRDIEAQNAPQVGNEGGKTISIQIRKPTRRGALTALGGVALVLGALFAIPSTRQAVRGILTGKPARSTTIEHYLAVLPFAPPGGPADLKYVADGITDSLVARLSSLHNVYVADSNAVAGAARSNDDVRLVSLLGVKLLVKGQLQASSDRISVVVKVEDPKQRRTVFTREFSALPQDLLTLQDNLFNSLAASLVIRPNTEELARTTARPTQDVAAYGLYLQGVNLLRGKRTVDNATQALALFEKAVALDAGFALAYSGIADACVRLWQEHQDDEALVQRAIGAAENATRLKPDLPQPHYALGTVYYTTGRTAAAIAELNRALELAPNSDDVLRRLGTAYAKAGRHDLAIAALEKATQVNPYYWNNHNALGRAYFNVGQNEKALAAFLQVTKLNPDEPRGWGNAGFAYYRLGDWTACLPYYKRAIQGDPEFNANLGLAYFFLGRYGDAAKAFELAVKSNPDDPTYIQSLADAYRWSSAPDQAKARYQQAIAAALQQLKTDPRNTDALATLGLSYAKTGDPARGLAYIRQARQIDAGKNDLMYAEAVALALGRDWPAAAARLQEALRNGYSAREAQADPELKELREEAVKDGKR